MHTQPIIQLVVQDPYLSLTTTLRTTPKQKCSIPKDNNNYNNITKHTTKEQQQLINKQILNA